MLSILEAAPQGVSGTNFGVAGVRAMRVTGTAGGSKKLAYGDMIAVNADPNFTPA